MRPSLNVMSFGESSPVSCLLTGLTHSPISLPFVSLPAIQRPEYFLEFARHNISLENDSSKDLAQRRLHSHLVLTQIVKAENFQFIVVDFSAKRLIGRF